MDEAKHTPGPWLTHKEGFSSIYIESRIGGGMLQEVASCGPTGEGRDQQEANARLIAAAPELLEALKEVVEILDEVLGFGTEPSHGNIAAKARAVIAKATGRADSVDGSQKVTP